MNAEARDKTDDSGILTQWACKVLATWFRKNGANFDTPEMEKKVLEVTEVVAAIEESHRKVAGMVVEDESTIITGDDFPKKYSKGTCKALDQLFGFCIGSC